ncbi:hypothetical protein [Sphingomonas desiccabilis]|uniref:Transmembrane protein n=1 Tax=Sphingomonas desiccabilis TaxID=429134 RepID=A0A4Q2J0X4_9SPHN|nr:hypothetical protein [Sphingomonas desiccabilis]MBB3910752.1 hypothetical protein [Sphingomonas desiccabilis]RXZ35363.1 hypothetical protein EO081_07015 [Sphingomonas desiccabilis]
MIGEAGQTGTLEPLKEGRQRAAVFLKLGRRRGLSATLEVTPAGLLAIGGLVSSILLSTAVLVRSAVAAKLRAQDRRQEDPPRPDEQKASAL